MISFTVNPQQFNFTYLGDYATYILNNLLNDFARVSIRFCKEAELPLLRAMSKYSEEEIIAITIDSYTEMLESLAHNNSAEYVKLSVQKWVDNKWVVFDKDDVTAEDLSLVFYIRRKTFGHFLDAYTKNVVLQKFIIAEVDVFTSQQELVNVNVYLQMQREKLTKANEKLIHHQSLLIDALEQGGLGSFIIDYKNQENNFFSAGYKQILEAEGRVDYADFIKRIHPEDIENFKNQFEDSFNKGGPFDFTYRYLINSKVKKIWTKGITLVENGERSLIRGIIKEII